MFKDLIFTLKKLEETKEVSSPMEENEKGYIDKQCPSKVCNFILKM